MAAQFSPTRIFRSAQSVEPLIRLWILRILIPLGGHCELVRKSGFIRDDLAEVLGLGHWIDPDDKEFSAKAVRSELRKLHRITEEGAGVIKGPASLEKNIEKLTELMGLSEVDCQILAFVVAIHNDELLDAAGDLLGVVPSIKLFHILSVILDLPEHSIRAALGNQGVLATSGLVTISCNGIGPLIFKLDILSRQFADNFFSTVDDPVSFLREAVIPSLPGELTIDDYQHIDKELKVVRPYLRKSIQTGRSGVNVFIYGEPGTGKNQLVKTLASEVGCELFEVASEDETGDPLAGKSRLRVFSAAQSFFARRRAIILFDEAEDVFNDGDLWSGSKSTAQTRKAWVNRILEENPAPTFWLSNSVECMDAAFIRRFDLVINLPIPPKEQREKILRKACAGLLDDSAIKRFAESADLAPAVVHRAASVASLIAEGEGDDDNDDSRLPQEASAIEVIINSTLDAQGHSVIRKGGRDAFPSIYDPKYIESDANMIDIVSGLRNSKEGRMCLYGPPGTGKTAYGKWLADELGVPLVTKRASDLMSKWVGGSEKNIAAAFEEAKNDGAVFLLDEADSFLRDRAQLSSGWEVSLVNEMLTQMESFQGIFIASTNLMESIDTASLRRFDLKVKLGYLRADQAWDLLVDYCSALRLGEPDKLLHARLSFLAHLTPGDYAAIARRHRFYPFDSINALVEALVIECEAKQMTKPSIGFVH